jgi:xanthine/CO dehydrogenase XdhC/CoxF family maturation factor
MAQQPRKLLLVFLSPLALEVARLAPTLGYQMRSLDPDRRRGGDPAPFLPLVRSVTDARIDFDTDVLVCDPDRPELTDVLAGLLTQPARLVALTGSPARPYEESLSELGVPGEAIGRLRPCVALDLGARTLSEQALAVLAGLLADRCDRRVSVSAGSAASG